MSCSFPDAAARSDRHRRRGRRRSSLRTARLPVHDDHRAIRNRPAAEHRFQIRYGDPTRVRTEPNPLGHDPAGIDVTLVLAVDPENESSSARPTRLRRAADGHLRLLHRRQRRPTVHEHGWATWAKEKAKPRTDQGDGWEGIESMVGFTPDRFLVYARFEALATNLGLETGLRLTPRRRVQHRDRSSATTSSTCSASTPRPSWTSSRANFRLGVAVRGSVAEHHLGKAPRQRPSRRSPEPIDKDGQPDFRVTLTRRPRAHDRVQERATGDLQDRRGQGRVAEDPRLRSWQEVPSSTRSTSSPPACSP